MRSLPLPPGNVCLPIIGETISFLTDRNFHKKRLDKYGRIYKTHIFGSPTVTMTTAEANQFLFTNENKYVAASWPKSTATLLGAASLTNQTGEFYQKRRKLMSQAFQPRALASYIPTMANITSNYLQKWEQMGSLTWYPQLRDYTFDIASTLLMGTDAGSQTALAQLFKNFCQGLFTIPISLPWTRFGKALGARQGLLTHIETIVRQRQQQKNPGKDALGLLLQAEDDEGNSLSLDDIQDQVILLLFAGHETLTSAIASFCLLTAQHPDVLAHLRAEQQQFSASEPLTMEHLKQMTYLEQVLKEVLRIIPPVSGIFRRVIQSFEFNGYLIPQGWTILCQITETHKNEEIYQYHQRFDPDRFGLDRKEDKQKTFGYIPFGGGLRECLGREFAKLEMRIFAAQLLRDYDWKLVPGQDLEMVVIPTPHPRDELKVKFSRRVNS
ncbi:MULTISPECIES: cytochrome P450 [unclassified Moorena]|uniref:cytochrome P450 n=1 Tax=unclassified Moorena TaxID=2683338 RepID=UPI0013C91170|nr:MULTISPECIES: cytochrome P450 [unclassified Moorena]NEO19014.1 cytochrome P450 [Moorena sp. SIO4A5]NEQ56356.1 cytochrome P450 [Moorena sp. SIO4A1]